MSAFRQIPIDMIDPNPDQPRRIFDPDKLAELADSIAAQGLLQPITVRPAAERFEIVTGERRWRAMKLLADDGRLEDFTITAQVRDMTLRERDILAIVENLQRADISPLEEMGAFNRLLETGMSEDEIAKATGAVCFKVKWRLQLRNLAPQFTQLLASGNLELQVANELARLPARHDQERIFRLARSGKLIGWKAVRNAVDAILEAAEQGGMFPELKPPSKADVAALAIMERKISSVANMVGGGWKDGECVVAAKVDPSRAGLMADKLSAIQGALRKMERELRNSAAQYQALVA